jgi:hypothetical protein
MTASLIRQPEDYLYRVALYRQFSWKQRKIINQTGLPITIASVVGDPNREWGVAWVLYLFCAYHELAAGYLIRASLGAWGDHGGFDRNRYPGRTIENFDLRRTFQIGPTICDPIDIAHFGTLTAS